MTHSRGCNMMCGLVKENNGEQKIVIAGSCENGFNKVESFDLKAMKWTQEDDFPFTPVAYAKNIPYGRTFLSVGGYVDGLATDKIYRVCQ